ncbi:hypothetical protein NQ314_021364 [Rhamnusium bicolor]|uniref:Uncharacterized protein n=1 Tax=Rhamnusium bicolor TaxID=1586634 RepID=A0AAV8WIH0_9CUCU|nr:hypothetical protein NQ314_021364 [Rhamnusium bicolor]
MYNRYLAGLVYTLTFESGFLAYRTKDSCDDYSFNYQRVLKFSKRLPKTGKETSCIVFRLFWHLLKFTNANWLVFWQLMIY